MLQCKTLLALLALLLPFARTVMQTITLNRHNVYQKLRATCLPSIEIQFSPRHTLHFCSEANLRLNTIVILMTLSPIAVVLAVDYFGLPSNEITKFGIMLEFLSS